MGVQFLVDVCQVLGVVFEEVGVDDLEVIRFDLSPAGAARVLAEINKLGFTGSDESECKQYAYCQSI